MKTKRVLALVLSVLMIVSVLPTMAFAAEQTKFDNFKQVQSYVDGKFEDVKPADWFYEYVKAVFELGLMRGRGDSEFATEDNMTVAEAMTIAARLRAIYETGKADFTEGEPWHRVYTDYCKEKGIADIANYDPDALVTREQFAEIFAKALPEEALAEINEIKDGAVPDVKESDQFGKAIYALYRAGILVGNDEYGTFDPKAFIKRVEVAAIAGRMAVPAQRLIAELKAKKAEGTVTVTFDQNYGDKAPETVTVAKGETVTAQNPTRLGYAFNGWFTAKSGGSKFDFSQPITADVTVYAQWTKKISGTGGGGGGGGHKTVTKTLAELFLTNPDIPRSESVVPPFNAWVNASNPDAKAFIGIDEEEESFIFKDSQDYISFATYAEFTKKGNDYVLDLREAIGVVVTCVMKDGVFSAIKFESNGVIYETSYNGTYTEPEAPEIKTIADVIETVSDFPVSTSWEIPAKNSWTAENGFKCYKLQENIPEVGDMESIAFNTNDNDPTAFSMDTHAPVTKSGNSYVFGWEDIKITFNMKDNKLVSIVPDGLTNEQAVFNGIIFTAPQFKTTTVADILPDDFPEEFGTTKYWKNNAGSTCCKTDEIVAFTTPNSYVDSVYLTAELTKDGDNWKITANWGSNVTFVMVEGALTSIVISDATGNFADLNGTYSAPKEGPKTVADVLGTVDGFPDCGPVTQLSEEDIPDNAWVNDNGFALFTGLWIYDTESSIIVADKEWALNIVPAPYFSQKLTKRGDSWTIDIFDVTYSFNMENDKLVSITVSGSDEYDGNGNGVYKAPAAEPVKYMAWDDNDKKLVEKSTTEAIEVTASTTTLDAGKFYVVKGEVSTGTLTVNGTETSPTTLILADGAKLTVTGDEYKAGIGVAEDKAFVITGQKLGTGVLIANGDEGGAGIGGDENNDGGTVTINGGNITANGGEWGAGIGGGDLQKGCTVTINGGTVLATGGRGGAGIGGGSEDDAGTVTINGGNITANGGQDAAGIGGGDDGGSCDTVTINGGTVTANGGGSGIAGIGGGSGGNPGTVTFGEGVDFTIEAGADKDNTESKTTTEYETDHSARYVYIEEESQEITLADLMATQPGFPTSEDKAWVNTTDSEKKMWLSDGNLYGANTTWVYHDSSLTKTDGGYEYEWNVLISYKVTFNMDGDTLTSIEISGTAAGDAAGTYAPAAPEPITDGYYLVGKLNGVDHWTIDSLTSDMKLAVNEGVPGEYKLDWTFIVGDAIKVAKVESGAFTTWYKDGFANEYLILEGAGTAGEGTLFFRPEGNLEWDYFYFEVISKQQPVTNPVITLSTEGDGSGHFVNFRGNTVTSIEASSGSLLYTQASGDDPNEWFWVEEDGAAFSYHFVADEGSEFAGWNPNYTQDNPLTVTADVTLKAKVNKKAEAITLAELIAKQEGFPTSEDDGWANDSKPQYKTWFDNGLWIADSKYVQETGVLTEVTGGYQIAYEDIATVTFHMDGDTITSIDLVDNLYDNYNGTYKPAQPMTVANFMATQTSFPKSEGDAWLNNTDSGQKMWLSGDSDLLVNGSSLIESDDILTKTEDGYKCTYSLYTVTFHMANNIITSVEVSGDGAGDAAGTYAPAPDLNALKAVYDTNGGANTLTFYYDEKDHSGKGITVFENGTSKYLFDGTKSSGKRWGYYDNRADIKSVVIDASVAKYKGLTNTGMMFFEMKNATSITGAEYLDVSNVTNMESMFAGFGSKLADFNAIPDVSKWDTSKVTTMNNMFGVYGNASTVLTFVPDMSGWNTSSLQTLSTMFNNYGINSKKLDVVLDLSGWDLSNVTDNKSSAFHDLARFANVWKIIIPAKTGEKENTGARWYVGDGQYYLEPASGKSFTPKVEVEMVKVEGVVNVPSEGMVPVVGATVSFTTSDNTYSTTTNGDGIFKVEVPKGVAGTLKITKEGYSDYTESVTYNSNSGKAYAMIPIAS